MKNKGFLQAVTFAVLILAVSLACLGGTATATAVPQTAPTQSSVDSNSNSNSNSNANSNSSSGGLTTFTDENKYYQIQLPADWKHDHTIDQKSNHYYIDTFTSPDGNAVVENIAYDDGTPFTGSDNGKFALQILNQLYSKTGKEGDIHVTDDSIQQDGSERLTWYSKGGSYSGISYFEVRNKTTFLIFTVDWANDFKDQYFNTLSDVVSSYTVP